MNSFDDRARRAATAVQDAARATDLEALLERVEDAHARPWWLVPAIVAGAAAATITAILVVPGLLASDPTPVIAPVGSERATAPPGSGVGVPLGTWQVPFTTEGRIVGFGETDQHVIAVGWDETDGSLVAWTSADGAAWTPHEDAGGTLGSVGPVDEVVDVVTTVTWPDADPPGRNTHVVTNVGDRVVLQSTDASDADDHRWSTVQWEPEGSQTRIRAIAATAHADRLAVVLAEEGETLRHRLSIGADDVPLPSGFTPTDIVSDGETLLLLGIDPESVVLRATDLGAETVAWERVPLPADTQVTALGLGEGDHRFVGAAGLPRGSGRSGWVSSLDGRTWRTHAIDADAPSGLPTDAVVTDGAVFVAGSGLASDPRPYALVTAADGSAASGGPLPVGDQLVPGSLAATRVGVLLATVSGRETSIVRHPVPVTAGAPTTPRPDEERTTAPPAAGACEPGEVPATPPATEGLSPAARDTYDRILAAAEACNLTALVSIAEEGEPVLVSFGGTYLDDEWLRTQRSTQAGEPIVHVLRRTLAMSQTVEETGDGLTIHSWPAAFGELTPETEQELLDSGLYTEDDLEGFREFGGFIGWRVGITDEGDWIYLIAGD